MSKGYRGFASKAAYQAHYSDPRKYAGEIPSMEAYTREAQQEREAQRPALTSRQIRFLKVSSRAEGYCPWDPPPHAPVLRNEEINPLTDAGLVEYIIIDDAWFITPAGTATLALLLHNRGGADA